MRYVTVVRGVILDFQRGREREASEWYSIDDVDVDVDVNVDVDVEG
jgi:hypothetical protein